jgi:peroxiredoxin
MSARSSKSPPSADLAHSPQDCAHNAAVAGNPGHTRCQVEPPELERPRMSLLMPGAAAPHFTLIDQDGKVATLSELLGRPVVLAFYPADWSPVCGDQMALYNEVLPLFREYRAEMLGVSVDGHWCHAAFAESRKLRFRLLADFEPKGALARQYGAYRDADGTSERALFVIDPHGIVRWSFLSPIEVNPGADGILEALDAMKAGTTP